MSIVFQIKDLHKAYGSRTIFDGAEVTVSRNQKIGVIGRNGAGKSTFLRILTGLEEADAGEIWQDPHLRTAVLEQGESFGEDELSLSFLLERSGKEEWECRRMAAEFHLTDDQLDSRALDLSGGLRMRLKLCAMLLSDPDFLFLDEPTNYLDLRTLLFLETFLRTFRGGYMVISHDREFLKRTCRHTMDVDRGQIHLFPGSVEAYLAYRREQMDQIERHNKNVEIRRQELQEFVNRFKAKASKAAQAQSKMKMIDKLHTIEIEVSAKTMRLRIPAGEKRSGAAVRVRNLEIGYSDRTVADQIDFEVKRGDRIAVLGDNGQGKSTLLKTLAGSLPALSGEVQWGFEIKLGYYAQHVYEELHGAGTVFEYLDACAAKGTKRQDILDLAGSMLFQGNDVKKTADVLSGGEKSRLCLAGVLLGRPDVLLLDEPTNHLDFETVEVLGAALREFPGTIFFVSHDRTFVHLVASAIVEVAAGKVRLYPGTYDEYVFRLEMEAGEGHKAAGKMKGADSSKAKGKAVRAVASPIVDESDRSENAYARRKAVQADASKARDELKKLEKQTAALETEKTSIMERVNGGTASRDDYVRLEELGRVLAAHEERWLALQAVMEEAKTFTKGAAEK